MSMMRMTSSGNSVTASVWRLLGSSPMSSLDNLSILWKMFQIPLLAFLLASSSSQRVSILLSSSLSIMLLEPAVRLYFWII